MTFSSKLTNPSRAFGNKHNGYDKIVFYANRLYPHRYELKIFKYRQSC